ncbi:MAG: hypothetical protein GY714_00030 [Desulfobacterales bacterium]|nr:hypothetical protein [Desulfobacterales bacterium]
MEDTPEGSTRMTKHQVIAREIHTNMTRNPTLLPLQKRLLPLLENHMKSTLQEFTAIIGINMGVVEERQRFEKIYSTLSKIPNLKILKLSVFWTHPSFDIKKKQNIPKLIELTCETDEKPFAKLEKLFLKANYHKQPELKQGMEAQPLPLDDKFLDIFRKTNTLSDVLLQGK